MNKVRKLKDVPSLKEVRLYWSLGKHFKWNKQRHIINPMPRLRMNGKKPRSLWRRHRHHSAEPVRVWAWAVLRVLGFGMYETFLRRLSIYNRSTADTSHLTCTSSSLFAAHVPSQPQTLEHLRRSTSLPSTVPPESVETYSLSPASCRNRGVRFILRPATN